MNAVEKRLQMTLAADLDHSADTVAKSGIGGNKVSQSLRETTVQVYQRAAALLRNDIARREALEALGKTVAND